MLLNEGGFIFVHQSFHSNLLLSPAFWSILARVLFVYKVLLFFVFLFCLSLSSAQDSGQARGPRKSVRSPLQALYTTDPVSINHRAQRSDVALYHLPHRALLNSRDIQQGH